jgi:transposase
MWLRDDQWARIEGMLPGKVGDRGRSAEDNRRFVEAVLWIARTGSPWRDLPEEFGLWNTVFRRFARWSDAGVWARVFAALAQDADFEEVFLDDHRSPINMQARQKGEQALGRSRGGLSTKIHALVEGLGHLAP